MDYDAAIAYLDSLVNYERTGLRREFADEVRLDTIRRLSQLLGNPHEQFAAVHIAGSKGKGSVAATVEAMARAGAYHTGLFTSPHLVSPRERIRIDGEIISRDTLIELVDTVEPAVEKIRDEGVPSPPTFFEVYAAMAFVHFAAEKVDLGILETGLGGRFDATNIINPLVCAITTLGLDHTEILGDTIEQIAFEKAGIIKSGVPVVVADNPTSAREVICKRAAEVGAPLIPAPQIVSSTPPQRLPVPDADTPLPRPLQTVVVRRDAEELAVQLALAGAHQAINLAAAIGLADVLDATGYERMDDEAILAGARSVEWPARLEIIQARPWVVLDCAHNPQSAEALAEALPSLIEYDKLIMVLGVSADKDAAGIAEALAAITDIAVLTQAAMPRALPVQEFRAQTAQSWSEHHAAATTAKALRMAHDFAGPRDCIVVTGSFFVIDEFLQFAGGATA